MNNRFLLPYLEDLRQLSEPHVSSSAKPKSLKVRPENLPKLEQEIRRILSGIKHGRGSDGITVPRPKNQNQMNYFYKARALLEKEGFLTFVAGYYDRTNTSKSTPAVYFSCDKIRKALECWQTHDDLETPHVSEWRKRYTLDDLNAFYAQHTYLGCCRPVLFRQWRTKKTGRLHGRLYALGARSYQRRKDRTNILIDGKATGEIDISASHLTGYLALKGFNLPRNVLTGEIVDLYQIDGIPREVVKTAILWIMGKGSIEGLRTWSQVDGYPSSCKKHKPQDVIDAVVGKYPVLAEITPRDQETIVFKEAGAVLGTVLALMELGIVALPTHDSILVQMAHLDIATTILEESYQEQFGVVPNMKIKCAQRTPCVAGEPRAQMEDLIRDLLQKATYRPKSVTKDVTKFPESSYTIKQHTHREPLLSNSTMRNFVTHRGRPRMYQSNAERQKAYRLRKKVRGRESPPR